MRQRSDNPVQNLIETLSHVFRQEAQHEVAVLLQQNVLPPVSPIGVGVIQILATIQFDRYPRRGA